jgi:LmbE family N-acetylglucosaminyl deacetylase
LEEGETVVRRRRLLAVFAHPDDETFGAGSSLAKYAAEGVEVMVVCATRGEVGEIKPESGATRENLGEVREAELKAALDLLGVKSVAILGYRDSGMAGSEDNKNPAALVNAPGSEVVARLVGIIRRHRPDVVITMDEGGGYGHPDHIRMTELTVKAFRAAGGGSQAVADEARPWSPGKLYYIGFPRSLLARWLKHVQQAEPDSAMARLDPSTLGTADERFTTLVDVSKYRSLRMRSAKLHRSQRSPFDMLPPELTDLVLRQDHFVRVVPPWTGGALETDLFVGI